MQGAGEEDLLRASVGADRPSGARSAGERPWRLSSQGYVAFFGGPAAVTAIALINASRLGLEAGKRWLIALAGAAGIAAVVVVALKVDTDRIRIIVQIIGLLSWGPMYLLQRSPDRIYHFYSKSTEEEDYDSLVGPGLLACLIFGVLQVILVTSILDGTE